MEVQRTRRGFETIVIFEFPGAPRGLLFLFVDDDLFDFVALSDGVDYFKAFCYFAKTGMVSVEVLGVGSAVADKKLGTSRISSSMRHRKHSSVMILQFSGKFAVNGIAWSTGAISFGTASLDHEIGNYTVEGKSIIKPF